MNPADLFPHINASLNGLAAALLIAGWVLIRKGHEAAHRRVMLSCFFVSIVFLASYLTYHFGFKDGVSTPFPKYPPAAIRILYFSILLTHTVLAAAVPFLAVRTIYLGLKNRRDLHRWWARITWPIWLYVSLTGVAVYVMLYQLYPPDR
ncbi:MAG: hypothetical protein RIS70_4269 [Planctomycetota bacterium]